MRYIIAMGILAVTITLSQLGGVAQAPVPGQAQQTGKSNRQAQQPAQAGQLEQEFIKLEQQWMEAVQKQDDSALGRIMATDFVHTTSVIPGIRTNKTQFIEASIQLTSRLGSFSLDQVAVRLVGDVAVVNALYSQKARQGEVNFSGDYFLTDIWVKQDNRWQVLARNLMRAQKETAPPALNQVANNEKGTKPLPPCEKGCREQFAAATKLCRVKASGGEEDSYEYDITCMQGAQRALKSCNVDCRAENQAKPQAKKENKQSVPAANHTSEKP